MKKSLVTLFSCERCDLSDQDEEYMSRHEDRCNSEYQERLASGQLMIGKAIGKLQALPGNLPIVIFFPFDKDYDGLFPGSLGSYRGYYDELSISASHAPCLVSIFLEKMVESIGRTYSGWKGGEFTMKEETFVWISDVGYSDGIMLVDICLSEDGSKVLLVGKAQ